MSNKTYLLGDGRQNQVHEYPEQDEYYIGRHLDTELKRGPLASRGCRDILFVFIWLGMWVVMVYCAMLGVQNGDISLITSPYDSKGNHCGYGVTKSYPNVFIVGQNEFYCVTDCPSASGVGQPLTCYGCNINAPYETKQLVTLCFPVVEVNQDLITKYINLNGFQKDLSDIQATWRVILSCAGIAFVMSIILTVLLQWTASCIVWGMLVLYLIIVAGIGTVAYLQIDGEFEQYKYVSDNNSLKWIAYSCWTIAGLSFLIIICLFKKIGQAIMIIKAASDFTREEWMAIFVPFWTFIAAVGFIAGWIVCAALIYSTTDNLTASGTYPYVELKWDQKTGWQLALYFFALIWNLCFLMALCQFVISSTCCFWYFSKGGYETSNPIIKSFCRGIFFNLGSLLFGSLILAFVWILKFILEQVHKQMKQSVAGDNNALGCALRCCKYLVGCFEKFIRFLNQNAYIMIALTGQSFCDSAYDVFYLITRNMTRVVVTHGLGEIFEFIGAVFVTASSTLICYFYLTKYEEGNITSTVAPTLCFILVSYAIGKMFMSLYGMGVDAILICYLVDYELNKNESGSAKHCPATLRNFVSEYN